MSLNLDCIHLNKHSAQAPHNISVLLTFSSSDLYLLNIVMYIKSVLFDFVYSTCYYCM